MRVHEQNIYIFDSPLRGNSVTKQEHKCTYTLLKIKVTKGGFITDRIEELFLVPQIIIHLLIINHFCALKSFHEC